MCPLIGLFGLDVDYGVQVTINEDETVTLNFPTTLDTDPSYTFTAWNIMTQPSLGALTGSATDRSFTFTPTADAAGLTSFDWNATDVLGDSVSHGPYTVTINIEPQSDPPQLFSSRAGSTASTAATKSYSVPENSSDALDISISDVDTGDTSTLAKSGTHAGMFSISGSDTSYSLSFNSPPDYEVLAGLGTTSLSLTLTATDSEGETDSQDVTISITDVNEAPEIAGPASYAFTMSEDGLPNGWPGLSLTASDVDPSASLSWSVITPPGNGVLSGATGNAFTINPVYTPNLDYDGSDVFVIQVSDGSLTDSVTVNVTVQEVLGDIPDFEGLKSTNPSNQDVWMNPSSSISHPENQTLVKTFTAVDPDGGTVSFSFDPNDATYPSFSLTGGSLSFTNPPDYETDSAAFEVKVKAVDSSGDSNIYTLNITLEDEEEAPVISSVNYPASIVEDSNWTITSGEVSAIDEDSSQTDTLQWTLKPGAENYPKYGALSPVTGTISTGAELFGLTYTPDPDYFGDDNFTIQVQDDDGLTDDILFEVTINPVEDLPRIYRVDSNQSLVDGLVYSATVSENTPEEITIYALDVDGQGILDFAFGSSSKDDDHFDLTQNIPANENDAATAVLSFKTGMEPNYEIPTDEGENGTYELQIVVRDNNIPAGEDIIDLEISVTNENEAPLFSSGVDLAPVVAENQTHAVSLTATDEDAGGANFQWQIIAGNDQSKFELNATSGESVDLLFKVEPNYESPVDSDTNNTYEVTVKVFDDDSTNPSRKGKSEEITVTVTDGNDAPVISAPPTLFVTEPATYVADLNVSDYIFDEDNFEGGGKDSIYWIEAGGDTSTFYLDPNGTLYFEDPSDAESGTNTFSLEVNASDGRGGVGTGTFNIEVREAPEPPTFPFAGSYKVDGLEDTPTVIYYADINASDPEDGSDNLSWTVITAPDPLKGSLSQASTFFTYTPESNINGDSEFVLRVSDSGGLSQDLNVIIYVQSVNDPPTIEYDPSAYPLFDIGTVEVNESTEADPNLEVIQLSAADSNDFQDNPLGTRWELTGKEGNASHLDYQKFFIDGTGKISFLRYPSYEEANSTTGNNEFEFQVILIDKDNLVTTKEVLVRLKDVNESPVLIDTSMDRLYLTVNEESNATPIDLSLLFEDPEGLDLIYSISVDVNPSQATLTPFATGFNFKPVDDFFGESTFVLQVTDATGETATLDVVVYVQPVNDLPSIEYNTASFPDFGSGLIQVFESDSNLSVIQLFGNDPKDNDLYPESLSWELVGKDGSATHTDFLNFRISEDGLISFADFPDYETMISEAGDRVFEFQIVLTDKDGGVTTKEAKVKVKEVDENPVVINIPSQFLELIAAEDTTITEDLKQYVEDPEGQPLSWALVDDSEDFWNEQYSSIPASTGLLTYRANQDFDAVDYFDVNASDPNGNWVLLKVQVSVTAVNDIPEFSWPVGTSGQDYEILSQYEETLVTLIDFNATDVEDGDAQESFSWSLWGKDGNSSHPDKAYFKIDPTTGSLTFRAPPDYDQDKSISGENKYEFQVIVTDRNGGSAYHNQIIQVSPIDEEPVISNYKPTISINISEDGVPVSWDDQWVDLTASDPDASDLVYWYHFNQSQTKGFVSLNPNTGELNYTPPAHYVGQDLIYLGISNEPSDPGISFYDQNITVTVVMSEVNDAPVIAPLLQSPIVVTEGDRFIFDFLANDNNVSDETNSTVYGFDVTGVASTAQSFDWGISFSEISGLFQIERVGDAGRLSFRDPSPYAVDGNNDYEIIITLNDGGTEQSTLTVPIRVQNLNQAPVFESDDIVTFSENAKDVPVLTAVAIDPDDNTVTYTLSGEDQSLFTINSITGVLSFDTPPDFENPDDNNTDGFYQVVVTAKDDGIPNSLETNMTVTIEVVNVNEAPVFSPPYSLSANENDVQILEDLNVSDPDGDELTYTLEGITSPDRKKLFFSDVKNQRLSFRQPLPDFEKPDDLDGDGIYLITVLASDGNLSTSQDIQITLLDVNDPPAIDTEIINRLSSLEVKENTKKVIQLRVTDADGGDYAPEILYSVQDSRLGILTNAGEGNFSSSLIDFPSVDHAHMSLVGDLDRDGDLDVVSIEKKTDGGKGKLVSYYNKGPDNDLALGEFTTSEWSYTSEVDSRPDHAVLADINLDGFLDLIVAYFGNGKVLVFTGTSGVSFEAPIEVSSDLMGATHVAAVDIDSDDDLDILVASDSLDKVSWFANSGGSTLEFSPEIIISHSQSSIDSPRYLGYEDLDGNGFVDIGVASYDGNFTLFMNEGEGKFADPLLIHPKLPENRGAGVLIEFADFNNDGKADILTASRNPNEIFIYYQLGDDKDDITFEPVLVADLPSFTSSVITADLDGDTYPELIVAMPSQDRVYKFKNKSTLGGVPNFDSPQSLLNGTNSVNHLSWIETTQPRDKITYEISGGKDQELFELDTPHSGTILFKAVPDFEEPLDTEGFNEYEVRVEISDQDTDLTKRVEKTLVVRVVNEEEPPILDLNDFLDENNVPMIEHPEHSQVIWSILSSNEGRGVDDPQQDVFFSIGGGEDMKYFEIINDSLSFKIDPDYENPVDGGDNNNTYEVVINAKDSKGAESNSSLLVKVTDGNDKPKIQYVTGANNLLVTEDNNFNFDLNSSDFNVTEPDNNAINWSLITSPLRGTARVENTTLFYQPNANYTGADLLTLEVADPSGLSSSIDFMIEVTPVNDSPVILTPFDLNYSENRNDPIFLSAFDQEDSNLTWTVLGGPDANRVFVIENQLSFSEGDGKKDFENPKSEDSDNRYEFALQVSDGNLSDEGNFSITIINENDFEPEYKSFSSLVSVPEGSLQVTTIQATDGDADDNISLVYGIAQYGDWKRFRINATTGELSFSTRPDFEGDESPRSIDGDNQYDLEIYVDDGENRMTKELTVMVENVNERAPVLSLSGVTPGQSFLHPENKVSVTRLLVDDDSNDSLVFSITGGIDRGFFELNKTTGDLVFKNAPNFEEPEDNSSADNIYLLEVSVFDGNFTGSLAFSIEVTNVEELPKLENASFFVQEDVPEFLNIRLIDPEDGLVPYPISITQNGSLGELVDQNGSFVYSPQPHVYGDDKLELLVSLPDRNLSLPILVSITEVNDPPKATPDSFIYADNAYVSSDANATPILLDVLANDESTPEDFEDLNISSVSHSLTRGTVEIQNGQISFTPDNKFIGPTSFSYIVSDGRGGFGEATVSISVTSSNSLEGWNYVGSFGYYFQPNLDENWIRHTELGWLYVSDMSGLTTAAWIWHDLLGWIWTGNQYFKHFYAQDVDMWYYWVGNYPENVPGEAGPFIYDFEAELPESNRYIDINDFQKHRIKHQLDSLSISTSANVLEIVAESDFFTESQKKEILVELFYDGTSPTLNRLLQ